MSLKGGTGGSGFFSYFNS